MKNRYIWGVIQNNTKHSNVGKHVTVGKKHATCASPSEHRNFRHLPSIIRCSSMCKDLLAVHMFKRVEIVDAFGGL